MEDDTVYTLSYLIGFPGEHINALAERATRVGVKYFVHNDRLYRVTGYMEVGRVEERWLRRPA